VTLKNDDNPRALCLCGSLTKRGNQTSHSRALGKIDWIGDVVKVIKIQQLTEPFEHPIDIAGIALAGTLESFSPSSVSRLLPITLYIYFVHSQSYLLVCKWPFSLLRATRLPSF